MTNSTSFEWIDELTDEQCREIFWLYVDPPEPFLEAHSPELLGRAMRFALRAVAEAESRQSASRREPSQSPPSS